MDVGQGALLLAEREAEPREKLDTFKQTDRLRHSRLQALEQKTEPNGRKSVRLFKIMNSKF